MSAVVVQRYNIKETVCCVFEAQGPSNIVKVQHLNAVTERCNNCLLIEGKC